MQSDAFYREKVRQRLSDSRFQHSLNVADCAVQLARQYGADPVKAYTAGLVHDILKEMPKPELKAYIEKTVGTQDRILLSQPALYHSVAGAEFLKRELDVDDEEILLAVRYHTSGRAGMTPLEKVVFTADFISADRNYPGVEQMRRLAGVCLESAIEEGLNFTIRELCSRRSPIYRDTADAYNDAVMARITKETEEI